MKWRKLGRIFAVSGRSEWLHSHGVLPIARPLADFRYRIYFSPRDRQGRTNVSWLDIDIRRPTEVLRVSEKPLLLPGPLGGFDDNGAMGCWIVEHGGKELLYYQGWNLGVTVPFYVAIGLAARVIGDHDGRFERVTSGLIIDRCAEEPVFVAAPAVLIGGGWWRMWYQSGRPWTPGTPKPLPCYDIRYAESDDGVHWTLGRPALSFAHPGEVAIARFCPLRERSGEYHAWYSYRGNDWGYRIGYASSPDGLHWTRRDDEAGIALDAQSWEETMICYPYVFDTAAGRFMLYNGGRYGAAGFGIAVMEQD